MKHCSILIYTCVRACVCACVVFFCCCINKMFVGNDSMAPLLLFCYGFFLFLSFSFLFQSFSFPFLCFFTVSYSLFYLTAYDINKTTMRKIII